MIKFIKSLFGFEEAKPAAPAVPYKVEVANSAPVVKETAPATAKAPAKRAPAVKKPAVKKPAVTKAPAKPKAPVKAKAPAKAPAKTRATKKTAK
jgi:hypothetical protein